MKTFKYFILCVLIFLFGDTNAMMGNVDQYKLYNIIDIPIDGNCLFECFNIAWSILKEIDPEINNEFQNQMDVRKRIYDHLAQNRDIYEGYFEKKEFENPDHEAWGSTGHQKIFSALFKVNIIVYQKVKYADYYEKVVIFDNVAYKHTIRLAHINPMNPDEPPMHYVLLQKENIANQEYQWYPKKGDVIKNLSEEQEYRVIEAEEDREFISVRDLNKGEEGIISFDDLYEYDQSDAEKKTVLNQNINENIQPLAQQKNASEMKELLVFYAKKNGVDTLSYEQATNIWEECQTITKEDFNNIKAEVKKELYDPIVAQQNKLIKLAKQFDGIWQGTQKYEIKGKEIYFGDNQPPSIAEFFTSTADLPRIAYCKNGTRHWGQLVGSEGELKAIEWQDGSFWVGVPNKSTYLAKKLDIRNHLEVEKLNIGDHLEVVNDFRTNTFYEDQKYLSKGKKLVFKNKKNNIIFVLNSIGDPWTHLQPIDATNFSNLKVFSSQRKQIYIEE